jgi:hypothetical protein
MTVDELAMQIRQMGYMLGLKSSTMVPLIDKIREIQEGLLRLRKERDEARRLACRCSSSSGSASESLEEAQLRGWDCFESDHVGEVTDMPTEDKA